MLEAPPVSRAPSVAQKLWPKLAVSLVLALGFVWLFKKGGVPLLPDDAAQATLSLHGVVAYALALAVCVFLRTWRWVYLLRPIDPGVKPWPTFGIGLVGFALVMLSPFRMGELVRPYLIARRSDVTFVQATGTIAGERIVDGLLLSIALFLGLVFSTPLSPLPDHLGKLAVPVAAVPTAARSALALFGAAFVAMGLFYWARGFARRLTDATLGRVSRRLAAWITHKIESVADGLSFLMSRDHGVPFFVHSVVYIFSCVVLVWVGVWATGLRVSLAEACVLMGVSGLGILIPAGPGFFGAYQIANFCALAMFFREDVVLREGSAYVFLSYVTQLAMTLATMALGAVLMRGSPEIVDLDAR